MSADPQSVPPRTRPLTVRQRLFVEAFCGEARGNATQSARIAGYSDSNTDTLKSVACEVLTNPYVKIAINERLDALSMQSGEISAELSDIARADWREFVKIVLDKEGNTIDAKLNLGDKIKALDILAKIRRMVGPETQVNVQVNVETPAIVINNACAALQIKYPGADPQQIEQIVQAAFERIEAQKGL